MFKSNAKYYIKETISSTDTTGSTFKISTDFELGEQLDTDGGTTSVILSDGVQIERMTITAVGGVATIVKRGITQDDVLTEDSSLNKTWNDGAIMTITAFAFDLPDLDKSSGRNTFTSDVEISNTKKMYVGDNAYITTNNNGTDLILKDANNSETTLSELTSGAGTDHKVKASATDTTAEFLNTKLTAGDGLSKTLVNGGSNESIDLDIDLTDTTIFVSTSSGAGDTGKVPRLNASGKLPNFINSQADGGATDTEKGLVEKATPAEVVTGTDDTRYVSAKDAYEMYNNIFYGTTNTAYDSGSLGNIANSFINAASYATAKSVTASHSGRFTISANMTVESGNLNQASARIYLNGVLQEQKDGTYVNGGAFNTTFSNFIITKGDVVRLDVKVIQSQFPGNNERVNVSTFNFKYNTIVNQTFFS